MNEVLDHDVFEFLIHALELSVVVGIGVIVYITKTHSKKINEDLEKKIADEMEAPSKE